MCVTEAVIMDGDKMCSLSSVVLDISMSLDSISGAVSVSKAQQLLQSLQATGDEGQQLTAVIEMCQVSYLNLVHI